MANINVVVRGNFGIAQTGLGTVGYTVDGGSRVTSGITEISGTGSYYATISVDPAASHTVVFDTGGGSPTYLTTTYSPTILASYPSSLSLLGLGGAAALSVGTTAGTVAAGDDSRITGAVQSISLTTPGILYTTPVTFSVTAGAATATLTLATQTANTILAGPTTGSAATPTMRSLVAADIPSLSATYSVIAGNSSIATVGTIGTGVWHGTKVGLAYGGTNADLSAAGGSNFILKQSSSGAAITSAALVVADIPSGAYNNSQAGAASTPSQTWSGTVYTAGTATTNFPLVYISPSGATGATTWSTAGTTFGVNAASGFTGNFIDFHVNGGASVFKVSNLGSTAVGGSLTVTSGIIATYAGTASQSAISLTGTLYAAGTAATNFPQYFSQPTGTTAVTTWSTAGTHFGVNAASGFAGNFIDLHVAGGASVFNVARTGKVTVLSAALTGGPTWSSGSGSPEAAVTAPVGSLYSRTDGGASTSLYVKESGSGNTGWVAK